MARYQKVWGSTLIDLVEGSFVLRAVDENTTHVSTIQHLEAVGAGTGNISEYLEDMFVSLVAVSNDEPLPQF